jgi:hypothetical protein
LTFGPIPSASLFERALEIGRSRSARRSATSSIPAEIRTNPSVRPSAARWSGGTDACVIEAGCPISDSTPPRLSASANSFTRSTTRFAASIDPMSKASMPPNPDICVFASACCGWSGSPG